VSRRCSQRAPGSLARGLIDGSRGGHGEKHPASAAVVGEDDGMDEVGIVLVAAALAVVGLVVMAIVLLRCYRPPEKGTALVISTTGGQRVVFERGALVLPVVHRAERMDLSARTIVVDRRGRDGLVCRDSIRADVRIVFLVRVNPTEEDVLQVARVLGCSRAASREALDQMFSAKFTEAVKSVGKRLEFEELCADREQFKDHVIEVIGRDLGGYALDDAAIEYLEQTPLDALDPNNIFDAEGIRKITERTARENIRANELRQKEQQEILAQNVAAQEALLRFEKARAEAEARAKQDITAHRW
jgi:uncharacterized membrane protein YqiK